MAKTIKGQLCQWSRSYGIWVSKDGTIAAMPVKGKKGKYKSLPIKKDGRGSFVNHGWYGRTPVDMAVAECYGPVKPIGTTKKFLLIHKDGDIYNCDSSNLEWIEYHYQHTTANKTKVTVNDTTYTVNKDGTVKKGRTPESICNSFFDGDMDLMAVVLPHICVPRKHTWAPDRYNMDKLMAKAGYVQGDDAGLSKPVVLHRDNDWQNFDSDNLEWVEESDSRYQDYWAQLKKDRHAECIKQNPGKDVPDWYN